MRSRLKEIVTAMEVEQKRRIEGKEIAKETGLDENTISRWMSPEPFKTIRVNVLVALCAYTKRDFAEMLIPEPRESA